MNTRNLFFIFLFLCNLSFSQDCIYEEFGINEGLPSSQTYDLYQDKNGILWIATDRGLANYNGYEIKTFGIKDGILNHVVLDFFPQKDGRVFCATLNNQLFYFHPDTIEFKPYKYNSVLQKILISKQHITNLYVDTNHNFHISCEGMIGKLIISKEGKLIETPKKKTFEKKDYWMHVEQIDDETFFSYYKTDSIQENTKVIQNKTRTIVSNDVISLNNKKTHIFLNSDGLFFVNEHNKLIQTITSDKKAIIIKKIDEHHFLTSYYYGGAVIRNLEGTIVDSFLAGKSVSNFLIDHDGGYWFSTLHSGVFYVKEPKIKFVETNINSPIWTLTKNKNRLYVGHSTGEVEKMNSDYTFTIEQKATGNYKAFVEYDSIHKQLYVHSGHVFYREKNDIRKYSTDTLQQNHVIKLSEPSKEGLIIAHTNSFQILKNEKSSVVEIGYRVEDAAFWKNEIYIGTPSGVFVYKNDSIHTLQTKSLLFKNRVDDIDINVKKNEICFASLGAGIIIFNKETNEIHNITEKDGLSNDIINELHIENKDELWVCTNSGLNKIEFAEDNTFQITGLKSSNGLLNDGISDVEVINDTVWIASRKGLMFAPKSLFESKKTINSYYLNVKTAYVNDSIVSLKKLQNLSHEENRVEFLVEGIFLKASNELVYKYKLEGLDDKWYYTNNRKIAYPSLPYGSYTFKVAAMTSQKEQNLTFIEVPIHIEAPFWKQMWFVISIILLLLLLIYLFFKYRILSYNRHIISELLRLLVKKIKRKEKYFTFKEAGKEIRIKTDTILYIKSSGNYIEVITEQKSYTIRHKIGEFINLVPDPLEYIRIHRSYIVRIDKVAEKNNKEVIVNDEKLPVSNSYVTELNKLIF